MAQHEEYLALISARLDGALTPQEEQRLREHLAGCAQCRRTAAELEKLHRALMTLPPVEVPDGLADRIMAAVEQEKVIPLPVKKNNPWRKWLATAAVLAVIVGAGASMHLFLPDRSAGVNPESLPAQNTETQVTGQAPQPALRSAQKDVTSQTEDLEEDMTMGAGGAAPQSEAASSSPEAAAPREKKADAAGDAAQDGLSQAVSPDPTPTFEPMVALFSSPSSNPAPEGSADGPDANALPETTAENEALPQATSLTTAAGSGRRFSGSFTLSPTQALELVVAHVNAGSADPLSNVYDQAALMCVNSLAESDELVSTVAYEGLTEDQSAYLFGVDAPQAQERYSHFLVALDTGEVSQIQTLSDTAKNSGGQGQWEFFESQEPVQDKESPQAEPSETPAEETVSPESEPAETPQAPEETPLEEPAGE